MNDWGSPKHKFSISTSKLVEIVLLEARIATSLNLLIKDHVQRSTNSGLTVVYLRHDRTAVQRVHTVSIFLLYAVRMA